MDDREAFAAVLAALEGLPDNTAADSVKALRAALMAVWDEIWDEGPGARISTETWRQVRDTLGYVVFVGGSAQNESARA